MVTTRSKHRSVNREPEGNADRTTYSDGKEDSKGLPKRKRRRISKSRGSATAAQAPPDLEDPDRKSRGKAITQDVAKSDLDGVPLDIIFEIFSFLHPLDLVRLTLTNKTIRNTLLSNTALSIWKATRKGIDPSTPDCPPDQTEPQWAILLYETRCMLCGSVEATNVQWNLRLRGCSSCIDKALISYPDIMRRFPKIRELIQRPKVSERLPQFESLNLRRKSVEKFPQVEDLDEILSLVPYSSRTELYWGGNELWFHRSSIKNMVARLLSFQAEARSGIQGAKERLDAFKEAQQQEVLAIMNPGPLLAQWISQHGNARRWRKCGMTRIRYRHRLRRTLPQPPAVGIADPAAP